MARSTSRSSMDVFIAPRDDDCPRHVYDAVLTSEAVEFISEMAAEFQSDIDGLHEGRQSRRLLTDKELPHFLEETRQLREDASWKIDPQPERLMDRRVDIGDASPANRDLLLQALNSGAQGVQVDFDDGHCPTWSNTLRGHLNIFQAARGLLEVSGQRLVPNPALLVIRPRAWNMEEPHVVVNGRVVSGALFDYALHLFHNGNHLFENGSGPFLYLPKLEGRTEAALWRMIFEYTEEKLGLPRGTIKATVLIENIYAAFEMDEILFELRHHSSGLNCGMWDYTASIVTNFGHLPDFILPDRQQYVSMTSDFLRYYMELLISTCRRRNAPATTGMVPFVLSELPAEMSKAQAIEKAQAGKNMEAIAGSDGALVYDVALVRPVQQIFSKALQSRVDAHAGRVAEGFYEDKLLSLPDGVVTLKSLETNVRVALLYVLHWLYGHGTVVVRGCVEDSATAEISRAQLWQWVYHHVPIANSSLQVNAALVDDMLSRVILEEIQAMRHSPLYLDAARRLVLLLSTMRYPPAFITTFLQQQEPLMKILKITSSEVKTMSKI